MKTLILFNYRSGSTALRLYLGQGGLYHRNQRTLEIEHLSPTNANNEYFLPVTNGEINCTHLPYAQDVEPDASHWSFIGDWWGNVGTDKIQEHLNSGSPASWSRAHLTGRFDRVAYLIRDGRNTTASLMGMKGGVEEQSMKSSPDDYFKRLAWGWRNRARTALDARPLPGFRIFKFEDLMQDRVGQTCELLEHLGYTPNREQIQSNVEGVEGAKVKTTHSSFTTTSSYNDRWLQWTDKQKSIFHSIAGKELADLGY